MVRRLDDILKIEWSRILLLMIGVSGILFIYLFQDLSFITAFSDDLPSANFLFALRKFVRLFLNDIFMLMIISAWFRNASITRLALGVQLVDLFILFPVYLFIKLKWEGDSEISSPLLSQLHRLIINPTLMILLIPAVYFQKISGRK